MEPNRENTPANRMANRMANRVANRTVFKAFAAVALLALSVAVAGCNSNKVDSQADLVNGKTLFVQKCGSCHQLAHAGTAGVTGPNLDDAFRQARRDGMGDTIQGVVQSQIAFPSQKLYPKNFIMPKNLVSGMNARDVAAYVAYVAAEPGKDQGSLANAGGGTDGKSLFSTTCGSCHTLADAGTKGAVGPNLDQLKPNLALVTKQVTNGGGGMPAFGGTLTPAQIKLIAAYVSQVAGKK